MSEWFVSTNIIAGQKVFQVVRLKGNEGVDHSGVRETYGPLFEDKEPAQKIADRLNQENV